MPVCVVAAQTHRTVRSHNVRVRVELHVRLSTQRSRRRRRTTRHYEQVLIVRLTTYLFACLLTFVCSV